MVKREFQKPLEILEKRQLKQKKKPLDVEEIFDHKFKEGGKVAMAKKEKKNTKDKLGMSFSKTDSPSGKNKYGKYHKY